MGLDAQAVEDKAKMSAFRVIKKLIFIAAIVFVAGYFYNNITKGPEDSLSKAQKTSEKAKALEIPISSDDVKQDLKIKGLEEEQKILSFDMTGFTKDGKKKWDIEGESADIIADTVILNEIKANAYSEDRTVVLKADSGEYDKKENSLRLQDNVVVTTSDGIKLTAEWFKWISETNKIETESFVEVVKEELYASGYGARASTTNKEVQLNKDVVVKQREMTINCGGPLIIDYGKNKASFHDRAVVTEPRGEMIADRLDVFFNPDSQKIETILAEGNVELKRGQNLAKGQKIIYTVATGEAVLTGNPEILIYSKKDIGDALTGD